MPRKGGEADKFGARYEGRWTVRQLLYVLLGDADSIEVEPVGPVGDGVEFELKRDGKSEVHQVKRQNGSSTKWTLSSLLSNGVLGAAQKQVALGNKFVFVSTVPPEHLEELCDRARRSADLKSFLQERSLTVPLHKSFLYLSSAKVYQTEQAAWQTLRGTWVHVEGEIGLVDVNNVLAQITLEGAGAKLAAVGLGDLVLENLSVKLDVEAIEQGLAAYKLRRRSQIMGSASIRQLVAGKTDEWKTSAARELLNPAIARPESSLIRQKLTGEHKVLFALGEAGAGKSAVIYQAVAEIEASGWRTLAFRLDRVGSFHSTTALGKQLDLEHSPVAALAAASDGAPCLLVVDQLDAVSFASGRLPEMFDTVASLLREAQLFPEMRVLLACRKFDVDNDHRIRALVNEEDIGQVDVGPLSDDQRNEAVEAMGLEAGLLNEQQRSLLSSPLNLVLLSSIADQQDALTFATTKDLFDAYWDRKRRDCRSGRPTPPRFVEVIQLLATTMSSRQRLSLPPSVLDAGDLLDDADVLASEGVLIREKKKISFFHEAFFDYAFARRWMAQNESLVPFLLESEQELFRRSQVRQILTHLREEEPGRFIREVEELLLHPNVRFHIKHVVLALLRALPDPSVAEWEMVEHIASQQPEYVDALWLSLRTVAWFDLLDKQGVIQGWLSSSQVDDHNHAMNVMMIGVKDRPDRVAAILAPFATVKPDYPAWLRWMVRFGNVHESRPLFELLIASIARNELEVYFNEIWAATYGFGAKRPEWAVELLASYLIRRPGAMDTDAMGRVDVLGTTEHGIIELVEKSADGAPEDFCDVFVPYMINAMKASEIDVTRAPIEDFNFSHRYAESSYGHSDLRTLLPSKVVSALSATVNASPDKARESLELLAEDPHETAQWILFNVLSSHGEKYAAWAASLLLERDHRFLCGNTGNGVWVARELLRAVGPFLDDATLEQITTAVLAFQPPWQERIPGFYQFTLLSALDGCLISAAASARLAELRATIGTDQPGAPIGMSGGFVSAPIPEGEASKLTDDEWLDVIARFDDTEEHDFFSLRGGAHEQSGVLQSLTSADPVRFANFAMRLTEDTNPAYDSAILQGLAQAATDPEDVFRVMRHFDSFRHNENDRWIPWPLQRFLDDDIPDDIIQMIIAKALGPVGSDEESWKTPSSSGEPYYGGDIYNAGINTARGQAAETLASLLFHDKDGERAKLVLPQLDALATTASTAVRSCVARVAIAAINHSLPAAKSAFSILVQDDDRLLVTRTVSDLILYMGYSEPALIAPVVDRMLGSEFEDVRRNGGRVAAVAGLRFGFPDLLDRACSSEDVEIRRGAAETCARYVASENQLTKVPGYLATFFDDSDEKVREMAAVAAPTLRTEKLRPFREIITSLIGSKTFEQAVNQLLITLEQAPDQIDDLAILCAERFIEVYGVATGDLSTGAAGNAREVGALLLRAYAQVAPGTERGRVLDALDDLLLHGAYGVDELVDATARS